MNMTSISVVYAAYNEEESIDKTLALSVEALSEQFSDFEILIVNDASTDSTAEIAESWAQRDARIRVIHNEKNMRQGATLIRGFAAARGDLITHNGIDYPFDLRELRKVMPLFATADVVVATRPKRSGYSLYRKILSVGNIALLHLLFDLKLKDYNFIQVYRRQIFDTIQINARSTGFVTPELLFRAHRAGFKIVEVEIDYLPREAGVARSGDIRVILHTLKDMLRYFLETHDPRQRKDRAG